MVNHVPTLLCALFLMFASPRVIVAYNFFFFVSLGCLLSAPVPRYRWTRSQKGRGFQQRGRMSSSEKNTKRVPRDRLWHFTFIGGVPISRVGSGRVRSGRVGSGRVGSGRVGSGRVGSGRVGSGQVTLTLTRPDPRCVTRPVKGPDDVPWEIARIAVSY